MLDSGCQIPTSGTVSVNGFVMDFSENTCDNPTVTINGMGVPATLSLEDAVACSIGG